MSDLRYQIAVVRLGRRSLTAWARKKDKPVWWDYAPCGQCGVTVTGFRPNIESADEFFDGYAWYRGADRIRDISLLPCHHRVDRFVYVLEGHEGALVDEVLRYERENTPK